MKWRWIVRNVRRWGFQGLVGEVPSTESMLYCQLRYRFSRYISYMTPINIQSRSSRDSSRRCLRSRFLSISSPLYLTPATAVPVRTRLPMALTAASLTSLGTILVMPHCLMWYLYCRTLKASVRLTDDHDDKTEWNFREYRTVWWKEMRGNAVNVIGSSSIKLVSKFHDIGDIIDRASLSDVEVMNGILVIFPPPRKGDVKE